MVAVEAHRSQFGAPCCFLGYLLHFSWFCEETLADVVACSHPSHYLQSCISEFFGLLCGLWGRIGGSLGVSAAVWPVLVAIVVKIQLVVRAIEWPLRIGGDSVLNLVVWELLLELVSCSKLACPFVFVFLGDLFAGRGAGVRKGLVRGCGSLHSDLRFDTLAFEVRSFLAPHLLVT